MAEVRSTVLRSIRMFNNETPRHQHPVTIGEPERVQ